MIYIVYIGVGRTSVFQLNLTNADVYYLKIGESMLGNKFNIEHHERNGRTNHSIYVLSNLVCYILSILSYYISLFSR